MDIERLVERRNPDALADDGYVTEPEKRVPVALDVDVAVVGAGVAGTFAALAAAQAGTKTALIDRFGQVGGNIGPGMILGGSLDLCVTWTHPTGRQPGSPGELMQAHRRIFGDPLDTREVDPYTTGRGYNRVYLARAGAFSYLATNSLTEAGVELMLSAYAADPIIDEGNLVRGVFVETASGRVAVRAEVTVDDTGTASLPYRAGAPMIRHVPADPDYGPLVGDYGPGCNDPKHEWYNETGLMVVMNGIDWEALQAFNQQSYQPTEDDRRWLDAHGAGVNPGSWIPATRQAYADTGYEPERRVLPGVRIISRGRKMNYFGDSLVAMRYNVTGQFDSDNWRDITAIEVGTRQHAWEFVQFLRRYIPGCGETQVVCVSPFLGGRGGPCVAGESTLTPQDAMAGVRHDDVIVAVGPMRPREDFPAGYDLGYRMLLPRELEGILVTGRGASYIRRGHNPGIFRARELMMTLGHATGEAAALCAKTGVRPHSLDVKTLQKALLERGFHLGDEERLRELGLV